MRSAAAQAEREHAERVADQREWIRRKGLRAFIPPAWVVLEPLVPFTPGWHIDAIADHLSAVSKGHIRRLAIAMPPRHMKSIEVAVMWPAWEWTLDASLQYLGGSYKEGLAIRDATKARRLIKSRWYQERWGDRFRLTGDQDAKARYDNDHGGHRIAVGTGGGTGEGGDRILVDDPHNVEETESARERESVLEWWDTTMAMRGNNPKTVAHVVIHQRLHPQDLIGHLLEQGGYHYLRLPAEYEPTATMDVGAALAAHDRCDVYPDPRKVEGELLWPERFGTEELAPLKVSLGVRGTAGQLQQRPTPAGGVYFPRTIPEWTADPRDPAVSSKGRWWQTWDLTFGSKSDSASKVSGQLWHELGAKRRLVDRVLRRMTFLETLAEMLRRQTDPMWKRAVGKLIEKKANGAAVIEALQADIPGIIPFPEKGDALPPKESRYNAVQPIVEAGDVEVPPASECTWSRAFVDLVADATPDGGDNDDADAMTQLLIYLHKHGAPAKYARFRGQIRAAIG